MRYQDCIFDLYGTLVDIHTDEERPQLWEDLTAWYREHGARARAVLRELEDGRLIMESLEILRGYDPWEETQAG